MVKFLDPLETNETLFSLLHGFGPNMLAFKQLYFGLVTLIITTGPKNILSMRSDEGHKANDNICFPDDFFSDQA